MEKLLKIWPAKVFIFFRLSGNEDNQNDMIWIHHRAILFLNSFFLLNSFLFMFLVYINNSKIFRLFIVVSIILIL